jgi:peptide/nickel transport system substrate-binding protein
MPSSKDETSPLSKLEVRQAISYAIDRNALCKAFGQNFYSPALQLYQKPALGVLPDSCNLSYDRRSPGNSFPRQVIRMEYP